MKEYTYNGIRYVQSDYDRQVYLKYDMSTGEYLGTVGFCG